MTKWNMTVWAGVVRSQHTDLRTSEFTLFLCTLQVSHWPNDSGLAKRGVAHYGAIVVARLI